MKTHLRIFVVIVGLCFAHLSAYAQNPIAKVDTFCTSWHVCIHGQVGIKSIELLDDPNGILASPARQYKNVYFDPKLDPLNTKKISFSGTDTVVCFDVFVGNPLDTAYAPIFVSDVNNVHLVVDLRYNKPPPIRVAYAGSPSISIDSVKYPVIEVGKEVCSTIVYINTLVKVGKAFNISDVKLKKNDGSFKINAIIPALPAILSPGDTLSVQLCFNTHDTLSFNDTLHFITDCFDAPLPIVGSGGTPLIYATDIDFGDVMIGDRSCKELTVSNKGKLPFILTQNWLLHDVSNVFKMDATYAGYLPFALGAGKSIKLIFCYTPTGKNSDSTTVDWNTNIDRPFTDQIKSWSFLKGRGVKFPIKPEIKWDRKDAFFRIDSSSTIDSVIQRAWLIITTTSATHIDKVFIDGPDSYEFSILDNELHYKPLENFAMNVGDSIWVDILFKPDLTKPRYDRNAELKVTYSLDKINADTNTIHLTGTWAKSDVKQLLKASPFRIRPNPAAGKSVIVSFASPQESKATLQVFDVLGREVYKSDTIQSESQKEIPIQNLSEGIYYIRLTSGNTVASQKFEVIK